MKNKTFSFLGALILVSSLACAEELPDAYDANSAVYQSLFENDRIRVMEMTLKPGDEIPMHRHEYPHSVYVLEAGQMTSTNPQGVALVAETKAGQLIWLEAKPHRLQNTGTTVLRALLTEIKTPPLQKKDEAK